jgi:hypothetical protein
MKREAAIALFIALGITTPLWAVGLDDVEVAYQRDVMRNQINKIDLMLDKNQPGGFDQPCGWPCRINVSGWINTDAYLANRPPVFATLNSAFLEADQPILIPTAGRASDLVLNNANVFVDAIINNWSTANMSLVYSSLIGIFNTQGAYAIPNSLLVYHPVNIGNTFLGGNVISRSIDTAYVTLGNLRYSPLYFRVGKNYTPFGDYDPYGFVQSENPTQLFSEINAPTAQLGFILPNGLYGSLYTFAGNPRLLEAGTTRRIQNGGADLGFKWNPLNGSLDLSAGYIADIDDSNFLVSYYTNSLIEVTSPAGLPNQKTPAYDLNVDMNFSWFDAGIHYVATTRDLVNSQFIDSDPAVVPRILGKAKLWGVEFGATFPVLAHASRMALGYQKTTHLAGLLPKRRIYVDYMVNIAKWFDLGGALFQDKDYNVGEGGRELPPIIHPIGTGNTSTVGQLRASIKFA